MVVRILVVSNLVMHLNDWWWWWWWIFLWVHPQPLSHQPFVTRDDGSGAASFVTISVLLFITACAGMVCWVCFCLVWWWMDSYARFGLVWGSKIFCYGFIIMAWFGVRPFNLLLVQYSIGIVIVRCLPRWFASTPFKLLGRNFWNAPFAPPPFAAAPPAIEMEPLLAQRGAKTKPFYSSHCSTLSI